jgi:hypothetical protein
MWVRDNRLRMSDMFSRLLLKNEICRVLDCQKFIMPAVEASRARFQLEQRGCAG